jgi:hypothetical protein
MRAARLSSWILLSIILLTGIPYLGVVLYKRFNRPDVSPLNAIPERTALIVRINHPSALFEEAEHSNLMWKEVVSFPGLGGIRNELHLLDSLSLADKELRQAVRDNPLYIVLAHAGRSEFGLLYMMKTGADEPENLAETFFQNKYPVKSKVLKSPYASLWILRVYIADQMDPLYLTVCKGVFIMSYHQSLIKKAIDRLSLNTEVVPAGSLTSMEATSGKKVDANIFVNIPYFSVAAWKIASVERKPDLVKFARFGDWCGMDLLVKKDELLFSGYTSVSDSNYQTLALWSDQQPQPSDAVGILPDNVSSFMLFGLQDLRTYLERSALRESRPETTMEPGKITLFNRQYRTRLEGFFLPWAGRQLCFSQAEGHFPGQPGYTLIAIQCADEDTAGACLRSLGGLLGRKTDSVKYREHVIYQADLSEGLNAFFGNFFNGAKTGSYLFLNGFILFGPGPDALKSALDHYQSGTTLLKQKCYIDVSDNISDKANIYFYCKPGKSIPGIPPVFNDDLTRFFSSLTDSLKKFEAVTFQLINRDGMYYTNLSLRFNPNPSEEGPLVWSAPLDTLVAGIPSIVARTTTGIQGILATDTSNVLYMVDITGKILWKQKLYGRVLGTFHEIRIKGSDSLYYIFNTENHLYLVRSDGEIAERFPMKFPFRATSGITVTDYNNTLDYRIMLAFRDNKVYNFTLAGVTVEGWERPSLGEEITRPVQYLVSNHKDYLVITGKSGQVMITDRRGISRIPISKAFRNSPNSAFYLNRSAKKGIFLTTDIKGRIFFIQENGKMSSVVSNKFSPGHFFLYEDLAGSGNPWFIYFDRNSIWYYNNLFKLTYSYKFPHLVSTPLFVRTVNGKSYIGVFSPAGREIYLFDKDGIVDTESAIRGTTPFDIGNLEDKDQLNLVIGSGRNLKCFRLTQF